MRLVIVIYFFSVPAPNISCGMSSYIPFILSLLYGPHLVCVCVWSEAVIGDDGWMSFFFFNISVCVRVSIAYYSCFSHALPSLLLLPLHITVLLHIDLLPTSIILPSSIYSATSTYTYIYTYYTLLTYIPFGFFFVCAYYTLLCYLTNFHLLFLSLGGGEGEGGKEGKEGRGRLWGSVELKVRPSGGISAVERQNMIQLIVLP